MWSEEPLFLLVLIEREALLTTFQIGLQLPMIVTDVNGLCCRYWQMPLDRVPAHNRKEIWDRGVHEASEIYKGRMVRDLSGTEVYMKWGRMVGDPSLGQEVTQSIVE